MSLHPMPFDFPALVMNPHKLLPDCKAALMSMHKKMVGGLGTELDARWDERQELVRHASCKPIAESRQGAPKCLSFGFCICSQRGRKVHDWFKQVMSSLKKVVMAEGRKDWLSQGHVVLRFQTLGDAEGATANGPYEIAARTCERWAHLAFVSLSPYDAVLLELINPRMNTNCEQVLCLDVAQRPHELALWNAHAFLDEIGWGNRTSISAYRLVDEIQERLVYRVSPKEVEVVFVADMGVLPASQKQKRARVRRAQARRVKRERSGSRTH